jgi:hypothetical protein
MSSYLSFYALTSCNVSLARIHLLTTKHSCGLVNGLPLTVRMDKDPIMIECRPGACERCERAQRSENGAMGLSVTASHSQGRGGQNLDDGPLQGVRTRARESCPLSHVFRPVAPGRRSQLTVMGESVLPATSAALDLTHVLCESCSNLMHVLVSHKAGQTILRRTGPNYSHSSR